MSKEKKREFNKKTWWGPIDSKELAEYMVKEVAKGFYIVAVLHLIAGLILAWPLLMVEAVLIGLVAFWLQKSKSRIPAIILLVLSVISVISTVTNISTGALGGTNIVLAVMITWFSVRAIQATNKLAENKPSTPGIAM